MKYPLAVTQIKMKLTDSNRMKALCSIVLNGLFAINDIRVVEDKEGRLIIAMPSRKMPDGKFKDVCNPVNAKGRKILEKAVLDEYHRLTTIPTEELLSLIF